MATIAILGPGAIGCAVGAALLEAGHHTVLFCANSAFNRLHITLPGRFELDQPAEVHTTPAGVSAADWLLICVKAQQVAATEPWLRALVTPATEVAMLQNGVEHLDPIASLIGDPTRILPVVVQIPAERTAPGAVTLNGTPHLVVPASPLGESFQALFAGSPIPARTTEDFTTRMWEKLCLNAVNGAITAITERDQSILRQPEIAELARQIVLECMAVGRAEGASFDDQMPTRIVTQLAGAPGTQGGGNSMLYDRLAGRELEAEARNGVIPRLGRKHGIPTPINAAIYALLKNLTPRPAISS